MYGKLKAHNFFVSTLDDIINDTDVVGTITLADKTVNGITLEDGSYLFRILVGLNTPTELEIFRITNVTGLVLTYDKRISPNGIQIHGVGDLIQCNDMGEFMNFLADNADFFGYTETIDGIGNELKVMVHGGKVFKDSAVDVDISNETITLADDTITYIYYDDALDVFGTTTVEPSSYYVISKVTTVSGAITEILDYKAKIVAMGSGGGGSGGHTIKNTDQGGTATTLTQRDTIRTKKLITTDDTINLETVIEGKWIATPDYIATGDTEYIESNTQMIVEGSLTIDGTLDNSGTLYII